MVPRSGTHAPLAVGGYYSGDELHGAVHIPDGLSLLVHLDPDGYVAGLDQVPADLRPPVPIVHLAFDTMVGIGLALLALGVWLGYLLVAAPGGVTCRPWSRLSPTRWRPRCWS